MDKTEKLLKWEKLQILLKEMKDTEMKLRKELIRDFFPSYNEGTNNLEMNEETKLVFKCSLNRKFIGDPNVFVRKYPQAKPMIRVKYELDLPEYRKLLEIDNEEFQNALSSFIDIKEGAPTLDIKRK